MAGHLDGVESMNMRQLCNVAYALQVQNMDEKEFQKFNKELEVEPGQHVSIGTGDLMAAMRGVGR
jgi:hypothetical protein